MKATSDDPFQPAAQEMQTHLSRIYSAKHFSWSSSLYEPQSDEKEKIEEVWRKTSKKIPAFRPPMNKKAPGTDGIFLHNLFGAQKHLSRLLEVIVAQGKNS